MKREFRKYKTIGYMVTLLIMSVILFIFFFIAYYFYG